MSLLEELERGQYVLILVKKIPQRPEHMASVMSWFPKIYPWRFITIEKWDKIPEHFMEIYHAMMRKGREVDGTIFGLYAIVLHGRGRRYGVKKPLETKYRAGCLLKYNVKDGIKIYDVKFNNKPFLRLLNTVHDVNAHLLGGTIS